jgi:hypothetical protein
MLLPLSHQKGTGGDCAAVTKKMRPTENIYSKVLPMIEILLSLQCSKTTKQ